MAEYDDLQLQGFKTIREIKDKDSIEKVDIYNNTIKEYKQDVLRTYTKETQNILNDNIDDHINKKNTMQIIPDLSNAKTIKESIKDWIDENENDVKQTQIIHDSKQTLHHSFQDSSKEYDEMLNSKIQAKDSQTTRILDSDIDKIESKHEKYQQISQLNVNTKQETWLLLEEFLKLSGLEKEKVAELIKDKTIKSKQENGRIYIEASTGTSALIKKVENRLVSLDINNNALDPVFVEKTIATILGLHDKVLSSKDETIAAFKSENSFLKEALVSMQEIYDDDKKTIEILRQQLQKTQEEVEFVKRKYKLMWGKVSNSTT